MRTMNIIQEMGKCYMIVPSNIADENMYMIHMIQDNYIDGTIAGKISVYDNEDILKYDISNHRTLYTEYENRQISYESLRGMFNRITEIIKNGASYLLEEQFFCLDPQYIFMDMETNAIRLVYIPSEDVRSDVDRLHGIYYGLADYLLSKIDHKDDKVVDIAYRFYKMSKEAYFTMESFCELIEGKYISSDCSGKCKSLDTVACNESIDWDNNLDNLQYEKNIQNKHTQNKEGKKGLFSFFKLGKNKNKDDMIILPDNSVSVAEYWYEDGETTFFGEDDETQFFDETSALSISFCWEEDGNTRRRVIDRFPILIGKKYEEVDLCISDASVSRLHAKITNKGNDIYVEDLGSTNGTYIDERKVESHKEQLIMPTSQIRFGKVAVSVVQ